jgi:hypothetical protein
VVAAVVAVMPVWWLHSRLAVIVAILCAALVTVLLSHLVLVLWPSGVRGLGLG